jgi:DNA-binding MarR family transcriptional regulator/GNAT superfamily N-acetyltransferase
MMLDVVTIRRFNRTVSRRLGVLNEKYLGRDQPLGESRLLFEIGSKGAPVRELRERLGLDSGYFSRLLRVLERKGLATTVRQTCGDGRTKFVRLTRSGRVELGRIDTLSDQLAQSILTPLTRDQATRLVSAMSEVDRLLRASAIELTPVDPDSPSAQWCLTRYFDELRSRFPGGYDRGADGAADLNDFHPPTGCFLVAELFGDPVGCGAIRTFAPRIGEIKRLWVSPEVRGLGVGAKLLAALERAGRKRKMISIRLDTHESLTEARHLYRTSGYREIARFNDNPYAHRWFEKALD